MQIKRYLGVMILAVWSIGSIARGQQSADYQPIYPAPKPIAPQGGVTTAEGTLVPSISGLSDWITYRRPCCEGAHSIYTPLYTEFYLRAGPSFPFGGQTLTKELKTGWSIAGGRAWLSPGFTPDLSNQPYYLLRPDR